MAGRVTRWAERVFDLGFVIVAAVWGLLFLLDKLQCILITSPLAVLMMAVWCPFFWWKYWRGKIDHERGAWLLLLCSVALTGLTIIAAFVILYRIART